jgi:hypothetical protein
VAGVLGAGAAGREVARRAGEETLILRTRERIRPPIRPAIAGDRLTLVAELLDADGAHAGELYGTGYALRGPGEPSGSQRLEQHTFDLLNGTIVGAGTAGLLEGTFAVLGGTGRYAGARGTYVVRRTPGEDAELVFTLLA